MEFLRPQVKLPELSTSLRNITRVFTKNKAFPKIVDSLRNSDRPLDLLKNFVNFWADISGLKSLKFDSKRGDQVDFEEVNQTWTEVSSALSKIPQFPMDQIQNVWQLISRLETN